MPPKSKRARKDVSEDEDSLAEELSSNKRTKAAKLDSSAIGQRDTDDSGEAYWPLNGNGNRRVAVSVFKERVMVNVREFYEKDGKMLPGKKGISLPLEQYNALMSALPGIEEALREKGETDVQRPDYSGAGKAAPEKGADDEVEDDEDE